jgi:hypothetical protein
LAEQSRRLAAEPIAIPIIMSAPFFRRALVALFLICASPVAVAASRPGAAGTVAPPPASEGWQSLFNGRDLAGWEANADPGAFTVVDGVLRARATHPTNRGHLFYVGDGKSGDAAFRDFELVAVVRGEADSNSGIFFHTDRATRDGVLHLRNGYEVQLNTSRREKRKTGSLYEIVDFGTSLVDESQWFTVRVLVEGKRIQVWINEHQTVDYTEPENPERRPERVGRLLRSAGGAIALQAHDVKSTFYFREIRIRRLP